MIICSHCAFNFTPEHAFKKDGQLHCPICENFVQWTAPDIERYRMQYHGFRSYFSE